MGNVVRFDNRRDEGELRVDDDNRQWNEKGNDVKRIETREP